MKFETFLAFWGAIRQLMDFVTTSRSAVPLFGLYACAIGLFVAVGLITHALGFPECLFKKNAYCAVRTQEKRIEMKIKYFILLFVIAILLGIYFTRR